MANRCAATTGSGKQCRNRSFPGSDYCRTHGMPEEESADSPASAAGGNGMGGARGNGRARSAPPRPRFRVEDEPAETPRVEGADWMRQEVEKLVRSTMSRLPISRFFPDLSPGGVIAAFRQNLEQLSPRSRVEVLTLLRDFLMRRSEYLTSDGFQTVWSLLQSFIASAQDTLKRRMKGEYEVDEFGLDEEFLDLCRPLFTFLYRHYWRVETTGIRNVPGEGRCLLVANHSGVLPWDGAMINVAIQENHTEPRYVRTLYLDWFTQLPWISVLLTRTGQVLACPENGDRLLRGDHLVAVFPEGLKGVGKYFKDRYQLARFGRGGFARMAIRARAPIVPVSVVGAEEIHPVVYRADSLGKLLGLPMLPITPTFPLLGLLGFIPLPSKWHIHFGEPVRTDQIDADQADNFLTVSRVTQQVRGQIQGKLNELRAKRGNVFLGR